jgi:hypothetical protein
MPNFRDFAARYLAEEAKAKLKHRTVVNYEIYLRRHAIPAIGNLKLDRVATSDIAKMHRLIGQTKPMTANRVVECVNSVYRYAAICGLVLRGHSPASHIEHFREQRRERFLKTDELARLGNAIREAETTGILWKVDNSKPNRETHPKKSTNDHRSARSGRLATAYSNWCTLARNPQFEMGVCRYGAGASVPS